MCWLALLKAVLAFARVLTAYMNNKQLMDAGEAKVIATQLESSLNALQRAKYARKRAVADYDANGVRDDDPNLRD